MKTKASTGALTKVLCAFVFAMFVLVFANTTTWAAPTKITGLKQTDAGTNTVYFSWDSNLTADYYFMQISTDGKTWLTTDKACDYTSNTSDYFYGLSSGTTYYIRVCGFNASYGSLCKSDPSSCVFGTYSDVLKVATDPDTRTTKITGTKATTNSLSFNWAAVSGVEG